MHLIYGCLIGVGALYGIFGLLGARNSWDDLLARGSSQQVPNTQTGRRLGWARRMWPATQMRAGGGQNW